MDQSFPENFESIANDMGIALYQKFSLNEASLFLRCAEAEVIKLVDIKKINGIKITTKNFQFFGYQLLEYLMNQVTDHSVSPTINNKSVDRIIRSEEVQELTGLGRTTLWRYENKGQFPRRVSLGGNTVGWKMSEVQNWIRARQ